MTLVPESIKSLDMMEPNHYPLFSTDSDKQAALQQKLKNCRISTYPANGRTHLSEASERGLVHIVELFLECNDVDPDLPDDDGRTPLSWAAERGHEKIVMMLLRNEKVRPDYKDNNDRTPLWWASGYLAKKNRRWSDRSEVVRLLLERNVDPNSMDKDKRTPLREAVEFGNRQIVELLLEHNGISADLADKNGQTPYSWAVESGHEEMVKLLLRSTTDPDRTGIRGRTPLSLAVERGHRAVIEVLLKQDGVDPNHKDECGRTPLSWAVCHTFESVEPGLSKDEIEQKRAIMELLLQKNSIKPNARDNNGRAPLWWAAHNGNDWAVKRLLVMDDIEPDPEDEDGHTPLYQAAKLGYDKIVSLLVRKDRCTLHILAQKGNVDLFKYLIEAKYDLHMRNNLSQTPLHMAASAGHLDIARILILSRASINSQDINGMTPLRLAIRYRHPDLIKLLLDCSAQTTGIMAYDWFDAYKQKTSHISVELSQMRSQKISLRFIGKWLNQLSLEPREIRRLVFIADYPTWSSCLVHCTTAVPQSTKSPISYQIKTHKNCVIIAVAGCFPIGKNSGNQNLFTILEWGKCGIAWTMALSMRAESVSCWRSIDHFSTLPYGWIPANGADFFALFMQYLKEKWLVICGEAEEHLSKRRLDQLSEKGNDHKLIHYLAEDAKGWAQLRSVLRNQIREARSLAAEYCRRYDQGNGPKATQTAINQFDAEVNGQINQLEQTVKDILQFEFAWVSINEAHKSTSIATSMKRLSWITFIFLPAMFASSLFGMNVNILQNYPDWRWYILFGGGFLLITFLAWLLFKHGQIESLVERCSGTRFRQWSNNVGDGILP